MMKAEDVRPGDTYDGDTKYEVLSVDTSEGNVNALVRYNDGGTGIRVWDLDTEVPLNRS